MICFFLAILANWCRHFLSVSSGVERVFFRFFIVCQPNSKSRHHGYVCERVTFFLNNITYLFCTYNALNNTFTDITHDDLLFMYISFWICKTSFWC
ncbi:hypothetical protein BJ742DRAFT_811194 [Cladochytrium replicatum]|nr:hypothetical protein BJ742DRAFT_811194 [Cladochytrium replicatum]